MGLPTGAFATYEAVGNREDLSDVIYRIGGSVLLKSGELLGHLWGDNQQPSHPDKGGWKVQRLGDEGTITRPRAPDAI